MIGPLHSWTPAPQTPVLRDGEIHIWRFSLALAPSRLREFASWLSHDENERAGRFHFQKDRDHFLAARGNLRGILARYLSIEPGELRFTYNSYGKPELSGDLNQLGLRFNLSHAGGMALVAVALRQAVGVDIENLQAGFAGEDIARRFFSPGEVAALLALPVSLRARAFFTCWTRKEAVIKAIGEGLSLPLDRFEVTFLPGEPARLSATRPDPREAGRWTLYHLDPWPGYIGAAAVQGRVERFVGWEAELPVGTIRKSQTAQPDK